MTQEERDAASQDPLQAMNQGDRWSFVAVIPDSSFIHTVHSGARTGEEAHTFISQIKKKSDGEAPLFHSDSWFYEAALTDNYSHQESVPYKGRGRPSNPKQILDPNLRYVQVHKKRDSKGRIESVTTRIVLGEEAEIQKVFSNAIRCKRINTDFVESRNGKYRKDNARLIRKTLCHSKKAIYHDAHICFLTQVFNYTRCVDDLKILINPAAKKFEQKYQHRSPAMAQNLIDMTLSLKELLMRRPQIVT